MTRSSESPDPDASRRPAKKMRKGTHSCFECRRRKIRCIFSSDNPNVCSECFARGSKCLGQEEADVDVAALDNRKNLRERVAKLEALVETLSQDRSEVGRKTIRDTIGTPSHPESQVNSRLEVRPKFLPESSNGTSIGQNAPFLSIFDDDSAVALDSGDKIPLGIPSTREAAKQKKIKDSNTRRALLINLPEDRAELDKDIGNTEMWWRIIQCLHYCFCGFGKDFSFAQFAEFAINHENPTVLAALLLCLAANGQKNEQAYVTVVTSLIVSDDDYAATLEGIECMGLLAKYHADIGQPRKAWSIFRRAIMFGQLMGLPRVHSSSIRKDTMFWYLYEADRYLSLLLGLPYGFSDAHCDINIIPNPGFETTESTRFRRSVAVLAGKVVDRNQGVSSQSYSTALDLDQELDNLAAQWDSKWWDLAKDAVPQDVVEFGISHEARMAQMIFFEVKMYLHLPYMLKTATNPRYEFSRNACFDAAKRCLQTYHALQSSYSMVLRKFYACQVIDFVGFTSAVVFLLGLLGYGRPQHANGVYKDSEDKLEWQLINKTLEIFRDNSPMRNSAVSQQSYQTLNFLRLARDCEGNCGNADPVVNIPYFGTLKIGKSKFAEIAKQRSTNNSTAPTPESHNGCTAQQMPTPPDPQPLERCVPPNSADDPLILYNGFYMPELDNISFEMPQADGSFGGAAPDPLPNWWQMNANTDIDKDWNWFMSSS